MFSSDIRISTGDSHSILQDGKRVNPSENVIIGDHCWIGTKVDILKGSRICNGSIVGCRALVLSKFEEKNIVLAGVPAKKVKENTDWCRERV